MIYDTILVVVFFSLTLLYLSWIYIFLTHREKKRKKTFSPDVSVLLPAHNEEEVIEDTINSIFTSDYSGKIEVIVINDGSTDNTAKIVKAMQKKDKRIKLFNTNHIGKSRALNFGVTKAKFDYLLFLDADSSIEANTLREIVQPLSDKKIAASSGSVRAKITSNPLTWFQDFEYILSSGWRYISSLIGSVSVLPGFFVIRKNVFLKIGGFSADTLTEDFDITLSIKKFGYEATMNPKAVMYTTTPSNIKSLFRQRIRWGRGNFQVIRKHADMLFSKKFGWLGYYILPTHIYWYIFSLLYLPSVLYWMLGGYYQYFFVNGNFISYDVLLYFIKWISSYGMFDLIYKVIIGVYQINNLLLITIVNYILTIFYNLLIFFKMGRLKIIHFVAYLFIFPYYLLIVFVQFISTIYELYNSLLQRKTTNIWTK